MRAQLGDRAEPHRPVRKLGLDRAVGVERVGHAVDHAGLEDRERRAWLGVEPGGCGLSDRRTGLERSALVGASSTCSGRARRRRSGAGRPSAGQNASKFSARRRARAGLERNRKSSRDALSASTAAHRPSAVAGSARPSASGAVSATAGRACWTGSADAIRRQRNLVDARPTTAGSGLGAVRSRNARPQPLDGGGRHLDRRRRAAGRRLGRTGRAPAPPARGRGRERRRRRRRRRPAAGGGRRGGRAAAGGGGEQPAPRPRPASGRRGRRGPRPQRLAEPAELADHGRKADQDQGRPSSAVVPAMMSVVPRLNSLIGIPNPIVATPAPATRIPNINKITDIRHAPAQPTTPQQPRCYGYQRILILFRTPSAMTNVTQSGQISS